MEKKVKKTDELVNSIEFTENFYIEELEERLEMTAAAPGSGGMTNKICWVTPINL